MTRKKLTKVMAPLGAVMVLALLAAATILVTALILGSVSSHGSGIRASATAALGDGAGNVPAPPAPPASKPASKPQPEPRRGERGAPRSLAPSPSASGAGGESDDALMAKLRGLAGRDPQQILRLAREANARDPDGPNAPERAWMVVKSLVDLQRFSEAKDEAQTMVNRYPGTSWAMDVQRHLLSNPL